jgi:hypothetical protein
MPEIKSHLLGFIGGWRKLLADQLESKVDHTYGDGDGHNKFIPIPNGKAGRFHKHILRECDEESHRMQA